MASFFQMNTASTSGSGSLPNNTIANLKGELKAITTRSGIVLDGPSIPIHHPFINLEEDERVEVTLMDQDLAEYTIKFTFPVDFVIVDYESDPRVSFILGRPFLQTARALIDVHGKEIILRDGDERLTLNMRHDTSSYSNQPKKESINLINVFNDSSEDFLDNLFSTNQPSGNPTFSSHPKLTSPKVRDDIFDPEEAITTSSSSPNQLLEEFADELALITFPLRNDDLSFDIESNLEEIEYLLHHDPIKDIDSILKDSVDQSNLADLNENLVDIMPEMFTDEHALDYSSPLLYDKYC
nr:reverse transcriptase domain-containing protein [Tanacetum cinerariifolium]